MARNHQPDQAIFRAVLPEDINWETFPAFPPGARLAVMVGHPTEPGPYVVRVKVPGGTKLRPGIFTGRSPANTSRRFPPSDRLASSITMIMMTLACTRPRSKVRSSELTRWSIK